MYNSWKRFSDVYQFLDTLTQSIAYKTFLELKTLLVRFDTFFETGQNISPLGHLCTISFWTPLCEARKQKLNIQRLLFLSEDSITLIPHLLEIYAQNDTLLRIYHIGSFERIFCAKHLTFALNSVAAIQTGIIAKQLSYSAACELWKPKVRLISWKHKAYG